MIDKYPKVTAGTVQPGFRIGRFTLRDGYGGVATVSIENGSGEGGDFSAESLEALIKTFYKEHF